MKVLSINKFQLYKPNLMQVSFANSDSTRLYKDEISFRNDYIKTQYGIDSKKIEVIADSKTVKEFNSNPELKVELVKRLVDAHEHAKKAFFIDNFSGRKFATNMMLQNGTWALGVSVGSNAENAICGERSAVVRLFSTALENMNMAEAKKADIKKDFQVKYLAMASSKDNFMDFDASKPCGDCLTWLNEKKFFDNNTQIISLEPKSKEDKTIVLKVKNLKDILPLRDEKSSMERLKKIEDMKLGITPSAQKFMNVNKIKDYQLRYTLFEAKQAYEKAKKQPEKSNDIVNASAVLMKNGKVKSAYKENWSGRWFTHPSLMAVSKILQSNDAGKNNNVNAIAYYGNKDVPYISELAKISQDKGSKETLVITVRSDEIKVRTISDYMPDLYVATKILDKRRTNRR